jgi:hypothetical protein
MGNEPMSRFIGFVSAALACYLASAGVMIADLSQIIAPSPHAVEGLLVLGMVFFIIGVSCRSY